MAEQERFISKPYFENFRTKKYQQKFTKFIDKTNTSRHILNSTISSKNKNFCKKYKNCLYLIALVVMLASFRCHPRILLRHHKTDQSGTSYVINQKLSYF